MNIGKRIKTIRKEKNITQQELATKIGKSKSTIEKYEAGKVENIPYLVVDDIAKALEVPNQLLMAPVHILFSLNPNPFKNLLNVSNDELSKMMREDYFKMQPGKTSEDMTKEAKENMISNEEKEHFRNIDELSNYKELFFISRLLSSIFKNLDINLTIITNEKVAKLQLTDNKDGYIKIFNTLEEVETFFDEINHGIQSSVDRLKYYDKNNK